MLPWALCKLLFPQVVKQVEDLPFELLQENAHIHPPLGVKDADLKKRKDTRPCCSFGEKQLLNSRSMEQKYTHIPLPTPTTPGSCCLCNLDPPPHHPFSPYGTLKFHRATHVLHTSSINNGNALL